jgi:DNA-binding response OmpR family regulator
MKGSILWADDQRALGMTFSAPLKSAGYSVEHVESGDAALSEINRTHFDLVLVDLSMPPGKWGGLWLLQEMSKQKIHVPVIVVSGEGSQSETIEALRLGAVDYITKDRLDSELLERIGAALTHPLLKSHDEERLAALVANGESDSLEFKSTLRWNVHTNKADPAIELAVLKSVAAFLNSDGGVVVVGVADDGSVVGLDEDRFTDDDKLQLYFWDKVRAALGSDCLAFLSARIVSIKENRVYRIQCRPSSRPVYVRWRTAGETGGELFFVRAGPRTEKLELRHAIQYIQDRFGRCDT